VTQCDPNKLPPELQKALDAREAAAGRADGGGGGERKQKWADVHEPGSNIWGTITRIAWLNGQNGEFLVCEFLDGNGDEWELPANRANLRDELVSQQAEKGDTIAVRYTGPYTTQKGRKGEGYIVTVVKPDAEEPGS
jgi:hypothetical protein